MHKLILFFARFQLIAALCVSVAYGATFPEGSGVQAGTPIAAPEATGSSGSIRTETGTTEGGGAGVSATGVIRGVVYDVENREPVLLASVQIQDLNRGTVTREDGDFQLRNLPEGSHTLRVQHVGYETTLKVVRVQKDDTTMVRIGVRPSIFQTSEIRITSQYIQEDEITTHVERVLTGQRLRQQLGRTIAETLEDEAGMAQRTMGPAPARPVLRGLGGERLLILEDGGRTGDLSATASDHALTIDPMTAEHIELIRGPSALIHGSNTMGGVINVIRGQIPHDIPDRTSWSGTMKGESVNNGFSGGVRGYGPVSDRLPLGDRMGFRFDLSGRSTSDMNTPAGMQLNTAITTLNASAGLGYVDSRGMLGFSGNIMDMKYGVPGGEGLAEAHPNGVDLEMYRRYLESRLRRNFSDSWLRRLDVTWNYSYYSHKELEKPDDPSIRQPVGTEFGVLTHNAKIHLHHNSLSFFDRGVIGVWMEHRDYASGGLTYTPETVEYSAAAYAFQERDFGRFNLQAALRYDHRHLSPEEKRSIFLPADITSRNYSGISGSLMGTWTLRPGTEIGATVTRTHRSPIIEELYAEGPHLANFAYEIGNPELSREHGWGSELFFRTSRDRYQLYLALFRNQMDNYIFPQDTGEPSIRRDDLNTFQFTENKVLMAGAEASWQVRLQSRLLTGGTVSYVRGDFIDDDSSFPFLVLDDREASVPMMPPLNSRLFLEFGDSSLKIGGAVRLAAEQTRTDQFEEPTDAYAILDFYSQYHLSSGNMLHTFSLTVENLADTEYRNHLSRIKSVMPEPGRNVKLLYRVYF
ncbi:TonB-dependent receptor [Balneolales bacterium ANBcel1]|nr:TonB-dependent receptor [Balneolales bacterium ANBcel1]